MTSLTLLHAPWLLTFAVLSAEAQAPEPPLPLEKLRASVHPYVRYERRKVSASENGWALLERAAQIKLKAGSYLRSPQASDLRQDPRMLAQARQHVAAYATKLSLLEKALTRKVWQAPARKDLWSLDFPLQASTKAIAQALVLRAHVRLAEGKSAAAARDLMAAREVGRRYGDSESALIGWLVGVAIEAIANRAIQRAAFDPAMDTRTARTLLRSIPPSSRADRAYQRSLRSEFDGYFLRIVAQSATPGSEMNPMGQPKFVTSQVLAGHPRPIDPRATARDASRLVAEVIRNGERKWSAQVSVEAGASRYADDWPEEMTPFGDEEDGKKPTPAQIARTRQALRRVPNPYGRLLIGQLLPVFDGAVQASFKQRADREATRLTLAARLYALRHGGKLPPSLPALVSADILSAVPTDPFSDRPFRYDAVRRVFWSVGPNGRDDGGKDRPGMLSSSAKDFVWSAVGHYPSGPPRPSSR